jgi:hypothetical protein
MSEVLTCGDAEREALKKKWKRCADHPHGICTAHWCPCDYVYGYPGPAMVNGLTEGEK